MTAPGTSHDDSTRIAARYPQRRVMDSILGIITGAAILTAMGLMAWFAFLQSDPPVAGMVRAFEVTTEQADAELVIQREDPAQQVTCFLFAQADNHERVGEMDVVIPPGTDTLTDVIVSVKTVREATSVTLENCRLG